MKEKQIKCRYCQQIKTIGFDDICKDCYEDMIIDDERVEKKLNLNKSK